MNRLSEDKSDSRSAAPYLALSAALAMVLGPGCAITCPKQVNGSKPVNGPKPVNEEGVMLDNLTESEVFTLQQEMAPRLDGVLDENQLWHDRIIASPNSDVCPAAMTIVEEYDRLLKRLERREKASLALRCQEASRTGETCWDFGVHRSMRAKIDKYQADTRRACQPYLPRSKVPGK